MTEQSIKRASLSEIRRMKDRGELADRSRAPEGEELGPEFWARAQLRTPPRPTSVHLKLDPEVFDYFKRQGKGHITRMQEVLRAYVKAHERR